MVTRKLTHPFFIIVYTNTMKQIITLVLALFISGICLSQSDIQLQRTSDLQTMTLVNETNVSQSYQSPQGNAIMIQQLGNLNAAYTNIASSSATINIVQRGNSNTAALQLKGQNINENIIQLGSNNSVKDYAFGTVNTHGLQLLQRGTNLSFERIGFNSTSSQIRVQMQGNSKSVIIRSFR